ncbi:MAG: hypothetical protein V3574_01420 [Candidatus Moraniibacteriota bacterium]
MKRNLFLIVVIIFFVVSLAGCSQSKPGEVEKQNENSEDKESKKISQDALIAIECGKTEVKDNQGIEYGTIIAEDGRCWLDRNLGASSRAEAIDDIESYGWLFQWGRNADGHQFPNSELETKLSSSSTPGHSRFIGYKLDPYNGNTTWQYDVDNTLWQGVDGVNNPCPKRFRLPTIAEWSTFIAAAKIEDNKSAFHSTLKLPTSGYRKINEVLAQGIWGLYWSSDPTPGKDYAAESVTFTPLAMDYSLEYSFEGQARALGIAVRCIKD